MFPFSFWKNNAPPFDPGTLNPTTWYRTNYTGTPWVPTPGGGSSGTNGNLTAMAGLPALVGPALNGLTPGSFAGVESMANTATSSAVLLTPMQTTNMATAIVLFEKGASAAPAADFWLDAQVLVDDLGNWGMGISSSGFEVAGYSFGVKHPSGWAAIANGEWGMGVFQFDGTLAGGRITGRLYKASGQTALTCSPLANYIAMGTRLQVGRNYNGSAFAVADIAEVLTFDTLLSLANLNNVRNYMNTRYGLTLA